jgi:hypothetical protein
MGGFLFMPSRWKPIVGGGALAVVFSLSSLLIFTLHTNFPIEYHPDESGKAAQVIVDSQPRNFNQPLMMLEAANVVRKTFGVASEPRTMVIAGRWTSAIFASIAVIALTLAGYWKAGLPAIALGGLTTALCPSLLVYAHYFKEDTALIVGIAIALAGAKALVSTKRPMLQLGSAMILGIGCAAAASGKYVGLVVVLPSLAAVAIAPVPKWWVIPVRIVLFLASAAVAVMAINARAFASFFPPRLLEIAREQIVTEFHHGTTGHDYLALNVPNFYCLRIAASELMPHIWVFIAVGLAAVIARRKVTRWGVVLGAFLATFIAALSYNTIPFGRYALPLTVLFYFLAAQLISMAIMQLPRGGQRNAAWISCVAAAVIFQGYQCVNFTNQFRDDSRQRLREWIALNIPQGSVVIEDRYVLSEGPGDPERFPNQAELRANIQRRFLAADAAPSLEAMEAGGVEYVAVAETNYDRFFEPGAHGLFPRESEFEQRRAFYADLFARGELIWYSKPSPPTHAYVNPELRLYRISGIAGSP